MSLRYGIALLYLAIALAFRAAFGVLLAPAPYLPVFFALLISSRFLGLGPSILITVLGAVGSTLIPPAPSILRLGVFLISAAITIWIIEVFRAAKGEAESNARLAEDCLRQLQEATAHRAEEERLSAQLRAVVESSEDAIISKDTDGVIQSWNRGAEQLYGYRTEEALGNSISDLLGTEFQAEENDIMERIRHGGRIKHFETVRVRKDGKRLNVSLTISPILDPAGKLIGASHIARDITERVEFETQLRQTQKLESLGVLAGGLAHDFNNLLTGIMGNASLAITELDQPERAVERLEEVLQASDRAAVLIRQMLAYAGKGRFLMEKLDLSSQVEEIVGLLRNSIPKLVDVRLRLEPNLPPIEADRSQIQQLVMNLALNAAEAIENRPGVVTISASGRTTEFEREVILEVSDTGAGMDEEVKSKIFDPFFTTKFTGRGLGLAAVLGIIRAHKGTISVTSYPGIGTTMTVVLPAASGEVETSRSAADTELRGYGLVLVADDEEIVRKMAKFTLERYGYAIETASDGRDALEKFQARPNDFAAILLDLTMPAMDGEEALRAVREIRRDVPVVLSSGYTESEALLKFHDLELAGFLQKPYTVTTLARKIKHAVRRPA